MLLTLIQYFTIESPSCFSLAQAIEAGLEIHIIL